MAAILSRPQCVKRDAIRVRSYKRYGIWNYRQLCSITSPDLQQRKHQSAALLAFFYDTSDSPHKRPMVRITFVCDKLIMQCFELFSTSNRQESVHWNTYNCLWIIVNFATPLWYVKSNLDWPQSGERLNITMPSYYYRDSHYTFMMEKGYTWKWFCRYWDVAQAIFWRIYVYHGMK